jgi:DNA-directed RNA polymerase specialized sigma24 family protein
MEQYRAAIEMALGEGWPYTEIARVVGVTEGAIRLYVKRTGLREVVTSYGR